MPAVGFFAQVPHYVNATYPAAAIALLTALGRHLGFDPPIGQLATRALERRVITVPGVFFDVDPGKRRDHIASRLSGFVRLSFGPEREQVETGLDRLAELVTDA
jgi:DNA-binding transcriptional MocR family regulator